MKKALTSIISLVMCLSLCACGAGGRKHTVTFNDGTTKTLSTDEILDICSNDAITWEKYVDAKISGEGKITGIENGSNGFYYITTATVKDGIQYNYEYYQIEIDDLIKVLVRAETFDGLSVGDSVRFDGKINAGTGNFTLLVDCDNDSLDAPQAHIFLK